ncbi:MAG: DsrE family protein [Alphaproteobacteria bacterium]
MAPERLTLIVFSGDYDRVHYALAMASAALATSRPVTLFLTMEGTRLLLAESADEVPGWAALGADAEGTPAGARDARHAEAGIATIEEMLSACVELGARFMVCEMGLRALHLTRAELRADVPVAEGGLVTLLAEAEADQARIVFI